MCRCMHLLIYTYIYIYTHIYAQAYAYVYLHDCVLRGTMGRGKKHLIE
uniref:Uncharacterized protein n=1 Tax=Rhizophora mucronata TaxID=61149 RepID=A0A2P2N5B7_RHIMU